MLNMKKVYELGNGGDLSKTAVSLLEKANNTILCGNEEPEDIEEILGDMAWDQFFDAVCAYSYLMERKIVDFEEAYAMEYTAVSQIAGYYLFIELQERMVDIVEGLADR